jgi:hypothetical protein
MIFVALSSIIINTALAAPTANAPGQSGRTPSNGFPAPGQTNGDNTGQCQNTP